MNPVPVKIKVGALVLLGGCAVVALLAGTALIPSNAAAIAIVALAPLMPVAFAMRAAPVSRVPTAAVLLMALWMFGVVSVAKLPVVVLDLAGVQITARVLDFEGTTDDAGAGPNTYRVVDGDGRDLPGHLTAKSAISYGARVEVVADRWWLMDPMVPKELRPGSGWKWLGAMTVLGAGATGTCLWLLRRARPERENPAPKIPEAARAG
ncbi:hypothetical protein Afil01_19620 [Actinorhabdospora filicis]|uniref:Uncharacterized protein n=1 Tax=Actinorhabdospora filicis TaxID=1785913 RepID=A0A9W6SHD2_9ACTN|nr:hypothetical protein [Actinorhabdospora filicis]GLZ77155.1 hypothetical protein Afil01_19620 [Actinorhabdospora filicis]